MPRRPESNRDRSPYRLRVRRSAAVSWAYMGPVSPPPGLPGLSGRLCRNPSASSPILAGLQLPPGSRAASIPASRSSTAFSCASTGAARPGPTAAGFGLRLTRTDPTSRWPTRRPGCSSARGATRRRGSTTGASPSTWSRSTPCRRPRWEATPSFIPTCGFPSTTTTSSTGASRGIQRAPSPRPSGSSSAPDPAFTSPTTRRQPARPMATSGPARAAPTTTSPTGRLSGRGSSSGARRGRPGQAVTESQGVYDHHSSAWAGPTWASFACASACSTRPALRTQGTAPGLDPPPAESGRPPCSCEDVPWVEGAKERLVAERPASPAAQESVR